MITYKNGIYQGQIKETKKDGLGVFWWPSGQFYIGEWINDMINGEGLLLINNNILRAQFRNNKLHGLCINHKTGEYLQYEYGQLNGQCLKESTISLYRRGELIDTDINQEEAEIILDSFTSRLLSFEEILERNQCDFIGQLNNYIGCISNNKPFGLGIMDMFEKNYKMGIFDNHNLNSIGQIFKDQDAYMGGIVNNVYDSLGIYWINSQQRIVQGRFQNGKCIDIINSKQGTFETYRILSEITFQKVIKSYKEQRVSLPYYQICSFAQQSIQLTKQSYNQKEIDCNFDDQQSEIDVDLKDQIEQLYKYLFRIIRIKTPKQQDNRAFVELNNFMDKQFQDQIDNLQTFRNQQFENNSVLSLSNSNSSSLVNTINKQGPNYSISHQTLKSQSEYFHLSESQESKSSMTFMEKPNVAKQIVLQENLSPKPIAGKSDPYNLTMSSRKSLYEKSSK